MFWAQNCFYVALSRPPLVQPRLQVKMTSIQRGQQILSSFYSLQRSYELLLSCSTFLSLLILYNNIKTIPWGAKTIIRDLGVMAAPRGCVDTFLKIW